MQLGIRFRAIQDECVIHPSSTIPYWVPIPYHQHAQGFVLVHIAFYLMVNSLDDKIAHKYYELNRQAWLATKENMQIA